MNNYIWCPMCNMAITHFVSGSRISTSLHLRLHSVDKPSWQKVIVLDSVDENVVMFGSQIVFSLQCEPSYYSIGTWYCQGI